MDRLLLLGGEVSASDPHRQTQIHMYVVMIVGAQRKPIQM